MPLGNENKLEFTSYAYFPFTITGKLHIKWAIFYITTPKIRREGNVFVVFGLQLLAFKTENSFLVRWYILTISSFSINVTGSRSHGGKCRFCYPDINLTWFYLSKEITRSRLFQGRIVSAWLSILKQKTDGRTNNGKSPI